MVYGASDLLHINYDITISSGGAMLLTLLCNSQCKPYEIHYIGYTIELGSNRQPSCDGYMSQTTTGDQIPVRCELGIVDFNLDFKQCIFCAVCGQDCGDCLKSNNHCYILVVVGS